MITLTAESITIVTRIWSREAEDFVPSTAMLPSIKRTFADSGSSATYSTPGSNNSGADTSHVGHTAFLTSELTVQPAASVRIPRTHPEDEPFGVRLTEACERYNAELLETLCVQELSECPDG